VEPLQQNWHVARTRDKKRRLLPDVVEEFRRKIIKTAQELQQQLAESAERPALEGSTTAADEDQSLLARLKERQRKRAADTGIQDRRPVAKPKAAKRQSKRTACTASGSLETPAAKRKDGRLTEESFAANAQNLPEPVDPGAASSGNAAQQRCRRIWKLQQELIILNRERMLREAEAGTEILAATEVGTEIRELIERAKPLTKSVLIDGVWFSFSGPTKKLEKYPEAETASIP